MSYYKWDSNRQQWKSDAGELALVIAAVALITAVIAVVLVLR